MSWIDRLTTDYIITTGDKKEYRPKSLKYNMTTPFNVAQFEYINTDGTDVKRGNIKGAEYPIELHFEGENQLDTVAAFKESSKNKNAWVIAHPIYDTLIVHPVSLSYNNSFVNKTIVTGTLLETIAKKPKTKKKPADSILQKQNATKIQLASTYTTDLTTAADISGMKTNTEVLYRDGKRSLRDTLDAEEYFNAFNKANAYIDDAISDAESAISTMQSMIELPYKWNDTVQSRINNLLGQVEILRNSIINYTTRGAKKLFENNAGTLISALAIASITNIGTSYPTRSTVIDIIKKIYDAHKQFVQDLNTLQSLNGGDIGSYVPDFNSLFLLNDLIADTLFNLFDVVQDAKTEVTITIQQPTNFIQLAHEIYGLLPDDSTLDLLRNNNNIIFEELIQLEVGRQIIYVI